MKLYYNPLSTYSQKVLLAFYETGVEFDPIVVNLMDEQAKMEFRELYPIGKIPLLILDDGHPIPESSIIIEYLSSISNDIKLISDDPTEARKTRFLDRMYDLYLNNPIGTKFFELRKPEVQQSQKILDDCDEKINIMYKNMENNLSDKTWNRGEMFTLADCAAIPPLFYAQQVAPFKDNAVIQAYWCQQALFFTKSITRSHAGSGRFLSRFLLTDFQK